MTTDTAPETTTPSAPEAAESVIADEKRVYEIGYHLIPALDENARGDAVDALRKAVEERNGLILNEVYPELIDLAYEMPHDLLGKRHRYTTAYFGWMFCEIEPAQLEEVQEYLKGNEHILRSLVIVTDRAHALSSTSYSFKKEGSMMLHSEDEDEEGAEEEDTTPEPKGELSVEEVDKAIDDLVGDEEKKEDK
jgi:ribosomal protein S6